jgi:hypothetical protein
LRDAEGGGAEAGDGHDDGGMFLCLGVFGEVTVSEVRFRRE